MTQAKVTIVRRFGVTSWRPSCVDFIYNVSQSSAGVLIATFAFKTQALPLASFEISWRTRFHPSACTRFAIDTPTRLNGYVSKGHPSNLDFLG